MAAKSKELLKRLGLVAGSFAISVLAMVMGLKLYAGWLGIHDAAFVYENQISMWRRDDDVGFVNKPQFDSYCFGTVQVRTNERGFRGSGPTPLGKRPGMTRVVAMGDSVMWGTGVREADSVPGVLGDMLADHGSYEVINAAVIGYASYQELRFLEKYVLPLEPDVVLVNYCINDFLPNEDPFSNVRDIYQHYLRSLLEESDALANDDERAGVEEIVAALESQERIWSLMESDSPARQELLRKVLVEIPLQRMAQRCDEAGARLVYVFVPPRRQDGTYRRVANRLKSVLSAAGAEYLDVSPRLAPHGNEVPDITSSAGGAAGWLRYLLHNRDLDNIARVQRINEVQETNNYLDAFHPTKRGNRIIADELRRTLAAGRSRQTGAAF